MKDNDRVVAAVSVTETPGVVGTTETTTKMFGPDTVSEETVQDLILGLITLQEVTRDPEGCSNEDHLCGADCMCYVGSVSAAMLEVILGGPAQEEASLFLQEQFEISQGRPRVFH